MECYQVEIDKVNQEEMDKKELEEIKKIKKHKYIGETARCVYE